MDFIRYAERSAGLLNAEISDVDALQAHLSDRDWLVPQCTDRDCMLLRKFQRELRNRQPSTDPNQFWGELEIRLLRSEAEAVILFDPIFPADPFAHGAG